MRSYQKITVIRSRKPATGDLNEELRWFGSSLGLFSQRDKDRSCFRIFIELVKSSRRKIPLSSDEIAYRAGLSRATVIHHLNKLMAAGIVVGERKKYILRVENLGTLVDEIELDLEAAFADLREIAKAIDKELGI